MSQDSLELLRGTLDMMILRILQEGPDHGYGITRRLQEITEDAFRIDEGSMYSALYRMEKRGWIEAEWCLTENRQRAKAYTLTAAGRERLTEATSYWKRLSRAVGKVMDPAWPMPGEGR